MYVFASIPRRALRVTSTEKPGEPGDEAKYVRMYSILIKGGVFSLRDNFCTPL